VKSLDIKEDLLWRLVYLLIGGIGLLWIANGLETDKDWLFIYSPRYIAILSWVSRIIGSLCIATVLYLLPNAIHKKHKPSVGKAIGESKEAKTGR